MVQTCTWQWCTYNKQHTSQTGVYLSWTKLDNTTTGTWLTTDYFNVTSRTKTKIVLSTLSALILQTTTTTALQPLFRDHPGETVPEENFWTLWCKGKLTEADTPTIRLGATVSGLTSAHLHHPPHIFTGRMPFLSSNQQCQSTEDN